jgi:hypothetical protein
MILISEIDFHFFFVPYFTIIFNQSLNDIEAKTI